MSTTARLSSPAHDAEARPRNRRIGPATDNAGTSALRPASLFNTSRSPSRHSSTSPIPATRIGPPSKSPSRPVANSHSHDSSTSAGKGWLDSALSVGWSSVQDFATSIIHSDTHRGISPGRPILRNQSGTVRTHTPSAWGPEPPAGSRPGIEDVATGTLAEREAALKTKKTASVLESHDRVNGGLDVTGKFKRRNSDAAPRDSVPNPEVEDQLVYIHHVQPNDTYAGIILRYRCQEDVFRRANGLWSRDNIQVRKWLALPVDACEVKGRPCDAPSLYAKEVDHLATSPVAITSGKPPLRTPTTSNPHDDYFASAQDGKATEEAVTEEEKPWTHVKWVKLDHCKEPTEIGRVSRKAMGYFPPRRKKSMRTVSSLSTPRGSFDVPSITLSSDNPGSPGAPSSRRQSLLANRPRATSTYASSAPTPSCSRVASGNDDGRPAWMRRPGGVGSLNRTVRAPGPEQDYLNSWAEKHIPSLNIDNLPSMAIMGSEIARFGFNDEGAAIVESPFDEGRDLAPINQHGTGLDKAAATIESWLRGAWAKRPNTPTIGPNRLRGGDGDLIELEDTTSDDGRLGGLLDQGDTGLLTSNLVSSGRADGESSLLRGRMPGRGLAKDKKAD